MSAEIIAAALAICGRGMLGDIGGLLHDPKTECLSCYQKRRGSYEQGVDQAAKSVALGLIRNVKPSEHEVMEILLQLGLDLRNPNHKVVVERSLSRLLECRARGVFEEVRCSMDWAAEVAKESQKQ